MTALRQLLVIAAAPVLGLAWIVLAPFAGIAGLAWVAVQAATGHVS